MAWDSSTTDYHLTPRGWELGAPPDDRIETWNRSTNQASGWSKDYISWTCKWVKKDVSRTDRDVLRRKHSGFMGKAGRFGDMIITIGDPL